MTGGLDMAFDAVRAPHSRFRTAPFWSWNDALDKAELLRQIRQMDEKGWGGYFMHSRVGLVTGYLSDDWMELIDACAVEGGKRGMDAWLYDEDKWPSGFAGGAVAKESAHRAKALVMLPAGSSGEHDRVIGATLEGGTDWEFAVRTAAPGDAWFNGYCYVDLMDPKTVDAFIDSTHEKYKAAVGAHFGKSIPGIFTDEPCYCMASKYVGIAFLPWSDALPAYFASRKGYRIEEELPKLFFERPGYRKTRYDFFESATLLFRDSFTKRYHDWCRANDLIFTGHFMAEDTLESQIRWIGAAMPHYRYQDWPGIDKLGRHLQQIVTVKQVSSAADQLGKERSFCEVFGCMGQHASFFHRKWISDWQAVLGISFVNAHLSLYSMRGERKRDYPANLFFQQPWWEEEGVFADYTARLCAAAAYGKRAVDVLVIHPIGSAWCDFSPYPARDPADGVGGADADRWFKPFETLSRRLMEEKLDFHYGDEILLDEFGRFEPGAEGRLCIGEASYDTIIVPPGRSLRRSTRDYLERFAAAHPDRLLLVEPVPALVEGEEAASPLAGRRFGTVEGAVAASIALKEDRIRVTDRGCSEEARSVWVARRTAPEGELVLIVSTEEKRGVDADIHLPRKEAPLVLDLADGALYVSGAAFDPKTRTLRAQFAPAGSLVLLYPAAASADASAAAAADPAAGAAPGPLPAILGSGVSFPVPVGTEAAREVAVRQIAWQVEVPDENLLVLDRVTLDLGGARVLTDQPVCKAWHGAFYAAAEGTPFRAEYRFRVDALPAEKDAAACELLIEAAENLERIELNGTALRASRAAGAPVRGDDLSCGFDPSLTRVPTDGALRIGENVLVIAGRKSNNITGPNCHIAVADWKAHRPTEVETAYLRGRFAVASDDDVRFSVSGDAVLHDAGGDLSASGFPFYAGTVLYRARIDWRPGMPTRLRLRAVNAACAAISVNGVRVAVRYWEPWEADLAPALNSGVNEIEVVLRGTLFNLTGPSRHDRIPELPFVGPRTFVEFSRMRERATLLPFGMGSAVLE